MTFVGNLDLLDGEGIGGGSDGGVVLGADLAESLSTGVGKRVVLTAQASSGERVETGARVLGVFRGPNDALERSAVLMSLQAAQRFVGLEGRVTDLSLFVADGADNRQVADDLRAPLVQLDPDLVVRPWQDHQPLLLFMSQIMGSVGWIARIVVFTALAFGMVNTLLAAVLERRREFGLLLSVGMKPRAILQQVALESWFQLAIALFSGLAVGLVVLHLIGGEIDMTEFASLGFPGMGGTVVLHYRVLDFVSLCLFLLVLGILVSMYPVRRLLKDGAMAISRRA
jgi:ABC-type lipoprotein release transport system permease subunit